jgi:hypothetical protein
LRGHEDPGIRSVFPCWHRPFVLTVNLQTDISSFFVSPKELQLRDILVIAGTERHISHRRFGASSPYR